MDFSWFGVTVVDIGVVSVSVLGFAWLFGRIAALEKQLAAQKQEYEKEIAALKQENNTLQSRVETLEEENRSLQKSFDILSGRYAEIKEVLSIFLKGESLRNSPTA